MPVDCPHDRCRFFLMEPDAACRACGRHPQLRPIDRVRDRRRAVVVTLAGALAAVIAFWLLSGRWLLASLLILGVVMARLVGSAPRVRSIPAPVTLDTRYDDALVRANHWLDRWRELYAAGVDRADRACDEEMLLGEARALAAEAAGEAVQRCRDLGAAYVQNALERLEWEVDALRHRRGSDRDADAAGRARSACALVERTLDERWVDESVAGMARDRVAAARIAVHRAATVALTGRATFLSEPAFAAGHDVDLIDLERRRVRIERRLFVDAGHL